MKKQNIFPLFLSAVVFLAALLLFSHAAVGSEETTEGDNSWEFNLAPFYLWGITMDGDITSGTQTVPVEIPFDDLVDNLQSAFILHFEGMHKSNWGFLFDANYLNVSNDMNLPGPLGLPVNVDFSATIGELSGLYRLESGAHVFDMIAGLRYTKLDNNVTVTGGPTLVDLDKDWIDPLVGIRWIWGFADKWSLAARFDIGGFGIGSALSTHGLAAIDWQPFKYVSFIAGYRALYQDYSEGSGADYFKFKATMHGPLLGVNFRW